MWSKNLAFGFQVTQRTIVHNLEGVSHEESLSPPQPSGNGLNWVAGHILATRDYLLGQLGVEPFLSPEEAKPYGRGTPNVGPGAPCVDFDRIKEGLTETSEALAAQIGALSPSDLEERLDPALFPIPVEDSSRGALLSLFFFHESYHAGQLGLGRRLIGKGGAIE